MVNVCSVPGGSVPKVKNLNKCQPSLGSGPSAAVRRGGVVGVVFSEDGKRFVGGMCPCRSLCRIFAIFAIFGAHCRFLSETNV